jgi:hypothetical protein
VVSHRQVPEAQRRVATLPCAYATCRDWERSGPGDCAGLAS